MMEEYINGEQFKTLLEDMVYKLENNQVDELIKMIEEILEDTDIQEKFIDRTYIGNLRAKKRQTKIDDIVLMLQKMSDEQVNNIHDYTTDEYAEPNHEAIALKAIVDLSKRKKEQGE